MTTNPRAAFSNVCKFCKIYNAVPALKTNSPDVADVSASLQLLKIWAETHFPIHNGQELTVAISTGNGYFPRVPWLCIRPPGQTVSDGVYFGLCFGREGNGAVAGCMTSITSDTGLKTVKRLLPLNINVDGDRDTTRYNNCYANPQEIFPASFDEEQLKAFIRVSLDLCLGHIANSPGPFFSLPNSSADIPREVKEAVAQMLDSKPAHQAETTMFHPESITDLRKRIMASMYLREGQPEFRKKVVEAYGGKCAISECDALDALEAAHIMRYSGKESNHPSNGILLRADIHTLFDKGLLEIDPATLKITIHPKLRDTVYAQIDGQLLRVPKSPSQRPNAAALNAHREQFGCESPLAKSKALT